MFSEIEIRRFYIRFGHLHADKHFTLLKGSELPDVGIKIRQIFEEITHKCFHCQRCARVLQRFKLDIKEDMKLNHDVFFDIFFL